MRHQPSNEALTIELHATLDSSTTPPQRFITQFYGDIYLDGGHEDEPCVGYVKALTVDLQKALGTGESAFELFNSHSAIRQFADLVESGLKKDGDEHPFGLTLDASPYSLKRSAFLILERIEIIRRYRGKGIGLDVINTMCVHLGVGCEYAMFRAFPLQYEGEPDATTGSRSRADVPVERPQDAEHKAATAKLVSYYRGAGFSLVPNSDGIMVRTMQR